MRAGVAVRLGTPHRLERCRWVELDWLEVDKHRLTLLHELAWLRMLLWSAILLRVCNRTSIVRTLTTQQVMNDADDAGGHGRARKAPRAAGLRGP